MSEEPRVSVKQMAGMLGLSQGTVSIVLNGRGDEMRISKKTQERVLSIARNMGYHPNIYAKRLRNSIAGKQTPIISLFCPYMRGAEPLARVLGGIQRAVLFEKMNVEIMVQPFEAEKLHERAHMISNKMCSGAIILSIGDTDQNFLHDNQFNIPIVMLRNIGDKYSSVSVDDYEAGRKVAALFAARGHKTAGLIMPKNRKKAARLREIGFRDTCNQLGITIHKNHVHENELSFEGGFNATRKLLEFRPLSSAVFVLISDMAIGSLPAFHKAGIDIPRDVELMTYGDNPLEQFVSPSLSTIRLPLEEMGCSCVEMVLNMINTGDWSPVSQIYPLDLVIRESCGGFPQHD